MRDSLRYGYLRGAIKFYIREGKPVDPAILQRLIDDAEQQEL